MTKGLAVRYCVFVIMIIMLAGCGEVEPPKILFDDIDFEFADAGSGEKLFGQSNNGAPNCVSCHTLEAGGGGIGPSLAGIGATAGNRVSGQSAEEYLYWSIVRPSQHLVAGYSNVMYATYEDAYEAADLGDLIAYMLTIE